MLMFNIVMGFLFIIWLNLLCMKTNVSIPTVFRIAVFVILSSDVVAQTRDQIMHYQPNEARRPLSAQLYRGILDQRDNVKVSTPDGAASDSMKLNDVNVSRSSKYVLSYDKSVKTFDQERKDVLKQKVGSAIDLASVKTLPELYIKGTDGSQPRAYRILFTTIKDLSYDLAADAFKGRVGFFLVDESNANGETRIEDPVNMEITSDAVDVIDPRSLKVSHLYMPSSNIELAGSNLKDSVMIRIRTVTNPEGYGTYLRVRPCPVITTSRVSLQGYGIQEIPVTVGFKGSSSNEEATIDLSIEKGSVSPPTVTLRLNETQTVYVRSEGTGNCQLTAHYAGLTSNVVPLHYVFPWMFIGFSLAGGLIGGLAKFYSSKSNKKFSWRPILGGVLIGLIGATAYFVLGINLLELSFDSRLNEFAVFGLSALFALIGIRRTSKT